MKNLLFVILFTVFAGNGLNNMFCQEFNTLELEKKNSALSRIELSQKSPNNTITTKPSTHANLKESVSNLSLLDSVSRYMFFIQDSTINYKVKYYYDSIGGIIIQNKYYLNTSTQKWGNTEKHELKFDSYGNKILDICYYKDPLNNEWIAQKKHEFAFDINGNKTLNTEYSWNQTTNQWVGNYKTEYAYDAKNNDTLELYYWWNSSTNNWINNTKNQFAFDKITNKQTLYEYYYWDTIKNQWSSQSFKNEYTYNANGDVTQIVSYDWDVNNSKWKPFQKFQFFFNIQGKDSVEYTSNWWPDSNDWYFLSKDSSVYDSNGYKVLKLSYGYGNGWVLNGKIEYSNDSNGRDTLEIYYILINEYNNLWLPYRKCEYAYDIYGNKILSANYMWDEINNKWIGESYNYKYEYTFDSKKQQTSISYYVWDTLSNEYIRDQKYTYDYDTNGNKIIEIAYKNKKNGWSEVYKHQYAYDKFNNKILEAEYFIDTINQQWVGYLRIESLFDLTRNEVIRTSYRWDDGTTDWSISDRTYSYYSSFDDINFNAGNKINSANNASVRLFPNPVQNEFTIEVLERSLQDGEIYNANGQLIRRIPLQFGSNTFNISNLRSGLYFLQVPAINGNSSYKLIKK